MGEFSQDSRLELVHVNGKPSHYQEKLHHGDHIAINETTASYLQSPKSIDVNAYINGTLKNPSPFPPSSSEVSLSSSEGKSPGSRSTTPDVQLVQKSSPAQSGLRITFNEASDLAPIQPVTNPTVSTPYGRRLIPQIMDNLAAIDSERTVFSLVSLSNGLLKLNPVSARQFTRAVDKTAWWLRDQVGAPESVQPVAYIGPRTFSRYVKSRIRFTNSTGLDDLRHILLTYACVKAGYAVCFIRTMV